GGAAGQVDEGRAEERGIDRVDRVGGLPLARLCCQKGDRQAAENCRDCGEALSLHSHGMSLPAESKTGWASLLQRSIITASVPTGTSGTTVFIPSTMACRIPCTPSSLRSRRTWATISS